MEHHARVEDVIVERTVSDGHQVHARLEVLFDRVRVDRDRYRLQLVAGHGATPVSFQSELQFAFGADSGVPQ